MIGRPLGTLLRKHGHQVVGATRYPSRISELEALDVVPAVMNALDAASVERAVTQPEVLIHQLTDLPKSYVPQEVDAARERNTRLRIIGTANLMMAATMHGAQRVVAQSIAFAYAPGTLPYEETAPLHEQATDSTRVAVQGVVALERAVTGTTGIHGIVLRYGRLYGPGTWFDAKPPPPPVVHPHAAAHAALLALTRGRPGIYNVAEDDGAVSIARARRTRLRSSIPTDRGSGLCLSRRTSLSTCRMERRREERPSQGLQEVTSGQTARRSTARGQG